MDASLSPAGAAPCSSSNHTPSPSSSASSPCSAGDRGPTPRSSPAREWRFQLFYWDYAVGVFLLALVLAYTLGSSGAVGRPFSADLAQAQSRWLGLRVLRRRHLQPFQHPARRRHRHRRNGGRLPGGRRPGPRPRGADDLPLHARGQRAHAGGRSRTGDRWRSCSTRWRTGASPGGSGSASAKGIMLSVAAGVLMGFFYKYVAQSMGRIEPGGGALVARGRKA